MSETKICRAIAGETGFKLREMGILIDKCGYKIVGKDEITISREKYEALKLLARA